ncbi:replicative DNA helicase [Providencia rettgeri]|nr:replicative DNA helicase [Providencia rettgeri]ELR5164967.1 replicative DNA helicase [Providencia rettgeri]
MVNNQIEASVIGGLLKDGLTLNASDVLATLKPEAFGSHFYRETYKVIQKQAKTRGMIDLMMVAEAMGDKHFADIMQAAKDCPSAANLKGYATMVTDNHNRREMISLMDQHRHVIESGTIDAAAEAMDQLIKKANELRAANDEIKPVHTKDLIADFTEVLEQRLTNGDESDTLKTGIHELDEITGGINAVDLVIVAARPAMGKTEFALRVTEGVASQIDKKTGHKKGVLIFSMEMSSRQIMERQIAGASGLSVSSLRNPAKMDDEGWARVSNGIGLVQDLDVWVVDASKLDVDQIRAIAKRHKQQYPSLALILVDYLGLIEKPKAERNDLAIGYISSNLKGMAKELLTPVISLSQLSRDVEKRPNKRPVNGDLRDSGSIEQDADSIIMLYRDAVYNENSSAAPYAEIIVTKNRFGKTGTVYQRFKNGHFMDVDQMEAANACLQSSKPQQRRFQGADV